MKIHKDILFFACVVLVFILVIFLISESGFAFQGQNNNVANLEDLKIRANLECLKNSHCSQEEECINNKCINVNELDKCSSVKLFTQSRKLKVGDSISDVKRVLTYNDLPYLLSDGKIVSFIDKNLVEHLYASSVLIKESKIEKENENYLIKNSNDNNLFTCQDAGERSLLKQGNEHLEHAQEPKHALCFSAEFLTLRIVFSKNVNFSNEDIKGQALRILGKEYIIGEGSTNSDIYLIYNGKTIRLEQGEKVKSGNEKEIDGTLVKITKGYDGNVAALEISFYAENIKSNNNYIEPVFNTVKFSFTHADDNFADISIGGNC